MPKYDRRDLRGAAIDLAANLGIPLQIIYCKAPEAVVRDRLINRQGDITDATVDLLASQPAAWEDFTARELPYITSIDPSDPDVLNLIMYQRHDRHVG